MKVTFVRTRNAPDRFYVRRDDGSEVSWSFPTFGDALPHDLVHLIVEQMFGIPDGFWGRVAGGADPAKINAEANRKGGALANKYSAFGDDLRGIYLAESLAGLPWGVPGVSYDDMLELAFASCGKFGIELPSNVNADTLRAVQHRLFDLGTQWRALGDKGSLELAFSGRMKDEG
jgi:hypothetical protein